MKPRIFISAVSKELKSARQLIANTLTALGYEPVWQDIFDISSDQIRTMLRQKVDSCSAVLQIVGDAYGGEPRAADEAFGRVSYTQYEALYARSVGKKVYYLIAQGDMPRDAEPSSIDLPRGETDEARADADERRRLQEEYRASIRATEHIYYSVHSQSETELAVRRLKDDLERLRRGFRSWMVGVSVGLVVITLGVTGLMWSLPKRIEEAQKKTEEKLKDAGEKTKEEMKKEIESAIQKLTNPAALAERIRTEIAASAEAKIKALSGEKGQGTKIAQIERERDLAVGRVDDLIKLIQGGLAENASPVFQRAAEILQSEGTEEALAYLESRRESELENARLHANQAKSAQAQSNAEKELRNRSLNAVVLEAELLESKLQWDGAMRLRKQIAELAPDWLMARNRLGVLQAQLGQFQDAEPNLRAAVKLARSPAEEAGALNDLANVLDDTNRLLAAELVLRRALALDEQIYGSEHITIATRLNNLMTVFHKMGRTAEAEPLIRRSLAIDEKFYGGGHPRVATDLNNLASSLQQTNNKSVAEFLWRRALAIDEDRLGPEHHDVARDLINLALLYHETNRLTEAEPLFRRALAIHERTYGVDHPHVGIALYNLGHLFQTMERLQEAEPLLRRALVIGERSFGPEHANLSGDLDVLALLLQTTDRFTEAEPLLRRRVVVLNLFEAKAGNSHPLLQHAKDRYRGLLILLKKSSDEIDQLINSAMETAGRLNPIAPEVERLLGPARPVSEVLADVDRQNKTNGKPEIFFLKASTPIAPHLPKPLIYDMEYLSKAAERTFRINASDDSVVLYEELIRRQKENPDHAQLVLLSRMNRAAALREVGEVELARDELRLLLTESKVDPATPAKTKGLTHYHLALCEWRLGDITAATRDADESLREFGDEGELAALKEQTEQLLADLKSNKAPPAPPTSDPKTKLEEARKRLQARFELASLPLKEPASPYIDQILGPAKSTKEVLDALDKRYREQGKPDVWFLPLDKPIAPHLDAILGPLPSTPKPLVSKRQATPISNQ